MNEKTGYPSKDNEYDDVFNISVELSETGYLSCFHLEKDNIYLARNKKNQRIKETLLEIENNHNHSWYSEMKERSQNVLDQPALFYRGNRISFDEMMQSADLLAGALRAAGVDAGNEIAVCMTNIPEISYIMLALNKLGAKMNSFSVGYNVEYIKEILKDCSASVIFVTDDVLETLYPLLDKAKFEKIVLVSRTRSLPANLDKCDEYVPELDSYYRINDVSADYAFKDEVISYDEFVNCSMAQGDVTTVGTLDTEFLVTYTSGSTKIGFPKAIIHTNRSLIVSGRFHDAEVSGNPDLKGLRALALIHADSNTCLITCISDILMQGWCVAFEPEYRVENALDYLILNKPNYANMTSSFWNEAARQYLVENRFSGVKLGFLLAAFAVGENIGDGEEYFLNRFLKKAKAGSSVSIKGFHLPWVPISIGGGDCEHGGIYYTLWKSLYSKLYFLKLRGKKIGMLPEKYVLVTALKQSDRGWTECSCNEIGVVVANSATTMKGYKNNPKETANKVIRDENGREWFSCNVLGYIDEVGGVHVKGRIEECLEIGDERVYPFVIDDLIDQDDKNILSSTTVFLKDGTIVANIIISPLSNKNAEEVVDKARERCMKNLPENVYRLIDYRVFQKITDFPLTGSGKRNIRALEEVKMDR